MTARTCPHCQESVLPHHWPRHICPQDPANQAAVLDTLRTLSGEKIILSPNAYREHVRDHARHLPSLEMLQKHGYTWEDYATQLNLYPATTEGRRRFFLDEVRRIAHLLHNGKYAPNIAEYDMYHHPEAPTSSRIARWADAIAPIGIPSATAQYYWQAADKRRRIAEAEIDRQITAARRVRAQLDLERTGTPGLPARGPVLKEIYDWTTRQPVLVEAYQLI